MLLTKVKRDWNSTSPEYRRSLFEFAQNAVTICLRENLKASQKIFVDRLLLLFAAVCCRMDDGFKVMYHAAMQVMASDVSIGLRMLSDLPVQLAELDMSRAKRVLFEAELKIHVQVISRTVADWCARGAIQSEHELLSLALYTKVTETPNYYLNIFNTYIGGILLLQ